MVGPPANSVATLPFDPDSRRAAFDEVALSLPYLGLEGRQLAEPVDPTQRPRSDRLQRRAAAFSADITGGKLFRSVQVFSEPEH